MCDRNCVCGKCFNYPYLLVRHLNAFPKCKLLYSSKYGDCKDNIQDNINNDVQEDNIKEELVNIDASSTISISSTDNIISEDNICDHCNHKYANKQNLKRHIKICKSNPGNKDAITNKELNKLINKKGRDTNVLDNISSFFKLIMDKNSNNIVNQDVYRDQENRLNQINSNNTNNTSNTTNNNNTTNNGTINNNVNITINATVSAGNDDNVPFVYPFGYENINFLTDAEILEILKSPEGAYLVLEKIYSHVDNNNFMKLNNKEKTVSYILSHQTIKLCNDKVFIKMLYEQSKMLLDRLFTKYYINLSYEHQLIVWNNINTIRDTLDKKGAAILMSKDIDEEYMNLISLKSHNSEEKRKYKEIKKAIEAKDSNTIEKTKSAQDKSKQEIRNMRNEIRNSKIDLDEMKNEIWEEPMADFNLDICREHNNPMLNFYDRTPRYKTIKRLELTEDEYLASKDRNVGDINNIVDMKITRNKNEMEEIEATYPDLPAKFKNEIEELLIKKPKRDNMLNLATIQPRRLLT